MKPLQDLRIVVPESRALDLFTAMLERQGAEVLRRPLILVLDLEDATDLDAWLQRLAHGAFHTVVFYTGEGVVRMHARAEALGLGAETLKALATAQTVSRGPKPVAALRKLGLDADAVAPQPTTEGVLALLSTLPLQGRRVGVQLYPGNDGEVLRQALSDQGAQFDPVTPYRYASDEEDEAVALLIRDMAAGRVDLIAFTSTPQVARLRTVAEKMGLTAELKQALETTRIAAIGPVTAEAVVKAGGRVAIEPAASFHLKPLVAEIVRTLGRPA